MTPYLILDPQSSRLALNDVAGQCALTIMAKAPRAGKVKTRLSPPLTLAQTAALNICFLKDTAENLRQVDGARLVVCYTPVGDEEAFSGLLPQGTLLIPQRGDGFGERLLAAATDILACGFSSVCLIDSDSPTVPHAAYSAAVAALAQAGDRAVLGASHDGGYYLIGLKQPHAEVFREVSWSTASVAAETRERCRTAGLALAELPLWYDVDDQTTLTILNEELLRGRRPPFAVVDGYLASQTRAFLLEFDEPSDLVSQGEPSGEALR